MIFLGGEVSVGSESRVTYFFNMGKMEDPAFVPRFTGVVLPLTKTPKT